MAPIVNYLKANGYILGKNLFCFTYDWRDASFHPKIMSELNEMIEKVTKLNNKKPVLLTHSGGLSYIISFMKLYEDYENLISSVISINSPVDGVGAFSSIAPICGYNLSMPIPHVAMKGAISFTSGSYSYMNQATGRGM